MMMPSKLLTIVIGLALLCATVVADAQEAAAPEVYRIGAGDVLRLNVPQLPSLDGEITVQSDGTIYVQQVGEVGGVGLSLAEAEELLGRRLRLFDPSVAEVVLGVVEFNALRVFALGAVSTPGTYTFETPPNLWEVLRAAGGPAEAANLASCRVLSMVDGRLVSTSVDLSGYLTGMGMPDIVLRGGDTLVVPHVADGTVGIPATQGVQVFGGVAQPTTVPLQEPTELITVLMLAGAPIADAELHKIDWVHRGAGGRQLAAQRVNLKLFLEEGAPVGNPLISPGDVVYVRQHRPGWFHENLPLLLSVGVGHDGAAGIRSAAELIPETNSTVQ
ncbi:MAG: polysaccharide biosynthesis/export family protein [Candidatus Krumholzibacteriia bacterium]